MQKFNVGEGDQGNNMDMRWFILLWHWGGM